MRDCAEKGRTKLTRGLRLRKVEGERHFNSKLSNGEALYIFTSSSSASSIASAFGISTRTVYDIRSGRTRKNSIADSAREAGGALQ